jgi:hypothetical protein
VPQKSGAVSVRKVRQKEVAYNYTFLGENLGYSEEKTEIRDQGSVIPASKNRSLGDSRTLWLLEMHVFT